MKNLTQKELEYAPLLVKYIFDCNAIGQSASVGSMELAMQLYPQYFYEEIERKRKWDLIPRKVHEAFLKELNLLDRKYFGNIPHIGLDISFKENYPTESEKYRDAFRIATEKVAPLRKKLHEKHYLKYGIEWIGI